MLARVTTFRNMPAVDGCFAPDPSLPNDSITDYIMYAVLRVERPVTGTRRSLCLG